MGEEYRPVDRRIGPIAVLTGAGISAESGVPTFRGAGGLWRQFRAEDLATPEAFARDPRLVWEWYDWRRQIIARCEPNAAHRTLVEIEDTVPAFVLMTQNVDGLHQRAGSRRVLTLHGDIWRVRCTREGTVTLRDEVPLPDLPPRCVCGALLRPDVVWFGENLDPAVLNAARQATSTCKMMLVIGTSAVVQPAASLPFVAKRAGAHIVEFNVEPTPLSDVADEVILGPAAETLPQWWKSTGH